MDDDPTPGTPLRTTKGERPADAAAALEVAGEGERIAEEAMAQLEREPLRCDLAIVMLLLGMGVLFPWNCVLLS